MSAGVEFRPGDLVRARGREWVVLPEDRADVLKLRPLGGSEDDATLIYLPLEPQKPAAATFALPDPEKPGSQEGALLLRDALRLKLRAGAGPFRSFGNLAFEPRAYQLVPLLMALKLDPIRLLIADDVGIGKTIEAGLVAREMLDRGEISRMVVICPPHLCEQWRDELFSKFHIEAEVVRPGTASRLERGLRADESIFEVYQFTVVSLDYIKSERRREAFLRACPEFVIVDEAHACVQTSNAARHQRYDLIRALAEAKKTRHMLFLTATPHSGDDGAFHRLLGLLDRRFATLQDMPESEERKRLREGLANHLIKRQRSDIAEWKDRIGFPKRDTLEATYKLSGDWAHLFDDILRYARSLIANFEHGRLLERRMSWWAALALLRCVSSSPAAASLALRTRLNAIAGVSPEEQIAELERTASETVLDGDLDDTPTSDESVPAGTMEATALSEDEATLLELIARADKLRGPKVDPKLALVIDGVQKLLKDKAAPIVFCRYIATAHYVAEHLRIALEKTKAQVVCVTGELNAEQREERIDELAELDPDSTPVLVATDCLSEGINLQDHFNAVLHYDLSWNPTRHEQREGRVDRFGQSAPIVRTMMMYGQDNPVDGAVLDVIIRKAERIRRELGVAVPLPADNTKVVEAIMKAVLLHGERAPEQQLGFEFAQTDREVDAAWEKARERERATRTVFAQRRLRPEAVWPEWDRTQTVLGGESDVERFVQTATQRLGAPLEQRKNHFRLPTNHLPTALHERLDALGLDDRLRFSFEPTPSAGAMYLYRSHPLVSALADYVAEVSLENERPDIGARCSAIFARGLKSKTTIYLLRLRYHLTTETKVADGSALAYASLAEELLPIAIQGATEPEILSESAALALLELEPGRNMEQAQKTRLVTEALELVSVLDGSFREIGKRRADELLADHRRVREASDMKGLRYRVTPAFPVDVIGAYVLMPIAQQ